MTTSWATAARTVPGLEHDPCPGDPPSVRRLAADLEARAGLVAGAATTCRGWQPVRWQGDAARAARLEVGGVGDALAPLRRSLDETGEVLRAWARELEGLQDEADALGLEALELRRRHEREQAVAAMVAGTPGGADPQGGPSRPEGLLHAGQHAEREALRRRVDELHARWLARSRACSADLDRAAPPVDGAWRGGWDLASDLHQQQVRSQARVVAWWARTTGAVSTVAGAAALVPVLTPVAAPVAVATGASSAAASTLLWSGADGSGTAAALATVGAAAGAGTRVAAVALEGGPAVARGIVTGTDVTLTAASGGMEVAALVGLRGDGEAPGEVAGLDGRPVPVTVHDVGSPWHVGDGGLTGAGFVGVAVVPVTSPPPASARQTPGPSGAAGPPARPGPARPSPSGPSRPAVPGPAPAAPRTPHPTSTTAVRHRGPVPDGG